MLSALVSAGPLDSCFWNLRADPSNRGMSKAHRGGPASPASLPRLLSFLGRKGKEGAWEDGGWAEVGVGELQKEGLKSQEERQWLEDTQLDKQF